MSYRSLLMAAVLGGSIVIPPAAFAQTYVAPGGTPAPTAPGGSFARPMAVVPDAWTTGAIPEAARPAAPTSPRASRVPSRGLR